AAADERDIRRRVKTQQLAHRIDNEALLSAIRVAFFAACRGAKAERLACSRERLEAFRMSRRDQEQCVRKATQHFGVRLQHDELLAFVRAGSDPDRTIRTRSETEFAAALDDFCRYVHIELEIADHGETLRRRAERMQALAIRSGLRRRETRATDCAARKRLDRP